MRKYVGILKQAMDLPAFAQWEFEAKNLEEADKIVRHEADIVSNYGEGPIFISNAYARPVKKVKKSA